MLEHQLILKRSVLTQIPKKKLISIMQLPQSNEMELPSKEILNQGRIFLDKFLAMSNLGTTLICSPILCTANRSLELKQDTKMLILLLSDRILKENMLCWSTKMLLELLRV